MTDLPALPPPDPILADPKATRWRDLAPWACGVGFVVLTAATIALWLRPPPEPASMEPLLQRLEARVARLEQRSGPDIGPLQSRLTALEQKPVGDPAILARIDALAGRIEGLTGRTQSAETEIARRLETDDARLIAVERVARQSADQARQAERSARIQAAGAALHAGQKLGSIPGAPAALARFASIAPPTETSLRLAYPAAERAALAANRPEASGQTFPARAWARVEELITVRQGDRVLIGDPAAGVLARARSALDVGDLAGATVAIGALSGPAAAAMAGWLADARALQEARAALAAWSENG